MECIKTNSMIIEYLKEKQGSETLVTDEGFVIYTLSSESVHINNFFIRKELRRSKEGVGLFLKIYEIAKDCGIKLITCNCDLNQLKADISMSAILSVGFKPIKAENNLVSFFMEVQ
jgi:hypothetical protein